MSAPRILPHSADAEVAVLAAMMLDPRAASRIKALLQPTHFYLTRHQTICAAIFSLNERGSPIDVLTLTARLKELGELQRIGGPVYLAELLEGSASAANVEYYAEILLEDCRLRRSIIEAERFLEVAYSRDLEELPAQAERVSEAASPIVQRKHTRRLGEEMVERPEDYIGRWDEERGLHGIAAGIPMLDRLTMGWRNGNLIVIAARPSVGKTGLAVHATIAAARAGHGVLFASLEMTRPEIHERLSAHVSGLDSRILEAGGLRDDRFVRAMDSQVEIAELPLFIEDGFRNPLEINEEATFLGEQIGLVIVDYVGLLEPVGRFGSREQEVAWLSRTSKKMATELDKPVLLLSQLSRALKGNEAKRPILSDLRDSGAIESDANVVVFVHDAGALSGNAGEVEHVELIVAKQRSGPKGIVDARYRREIGHFTNWP